MSRRSGIAHDLLLAAAAALLAGCTERAVSPLASTARVADEAELPAGGATTTIRWNTEAQTLVIGSVAVAPIANRMYALVSIAQRAALESGHGPRALAAEIAASAGVLTYLFPAQAADLALMASADEAAIASTAEDAEQVVQGEALGRSLADAIVARARTDGSDRVVTLTIPVGPGYWTGNPVVPQWPAVRPFVLESGDEMRPPPPPAFGSPAFLAALDEVRTVVAHPTPAQTQAVMFWFDPQSAGQHAGHWNRIATGLIVRDGLDERRAAQVLSLMNVAISDATIACFDAKYFYWLIRPYQADPTITPLLGKPRHASYPSAHSCTGGAAVGVLGAFFEHDRDALTAMEVEMDNSRIWAGLHYRFDVETGHALGHRVAERVLAAANRDREDERSR